jgi:predicted DCC family thiol-disulfide oxidoreductase YuxK
MAQHTKPTVVFDGTCGICTAATAWVKQQDDDGKLNVIPYQHAAPGALSPGLTAEMCSKSVYLVLPDGRRFKEARASFETLKRLPGVYGVIGWLLANPVFAVLGAPFYRLVAHNRTQVSVWLGMTACAVLPPKVKIESS